jgi:prefoldin subunit 5
MKGVIKEADEVISTLNKRIKQLEDEQIWWSKSIGKNEWANWK